MSEEKHWLIGELRSIAFGAIVTGLVIAMVGSSPDTIVAKFFQTVPQWVSAWQFKSALIFVGLVLFAIGVVMLIRRAVLSIQTPKKENAPIAERPHPMYEAVDYIAGKINEEKDKDCFPQTRLAIRQAALEGRIRVWGHKSFNLQGNSFSEVGTLIPPEYWIEADLSATATDAEPYEYMVPHTFPQRFSGGEYGDQIFLYRKLKIDWLEIEKEWP